MSDVTITIKRKKRTPSRGTSRRKGMLAKAPGKQDLGRRRVKSDVKIRFWDLGQYVNGDPLSAGMVDFYLGGGVLNDLINSINAEILAVPDPFASFMPLDKASPVATSLLLSYAGGSYIGKPADLDAYSGNTLSISASDFETFVFRGDSAFFLDANFDWSMWGDFFHVTNTPDPDGPDVPLPTGSIDVGLAPSPAAQSGAVQYDFPAYYELLNNFYEVVRRDIAPIDMSGSYAGIYDRWRAMRESPNARAFQAVPPSPVYSPSSPASFAPSGFFPAPPSLPPNTSGSDFWAGGIGTPLFSVPYTNMLVAIIRKGTQLYYVWSSTE